MKRDSSVDSYGEDLSFYSSEEENMTKQDNSRNNFLNSYITFEQAKIKKESYVSIQNKINNKKNETFEKGKFKEDKNNSLWANLYDTFFNNHSDLNINLTELDLRCRLPSREVFMDKEIKKSKPIDKKEEVKFNSLMQLRNFIEKYSNKRKINLFHRILNSKNENRIKNESTSKGLVKVDIGSSETKRFRPMERRASLASLVSNIDIEKIKSESHQQGSILDLIKQQVKISNQQNSHESPFHKKQIELRQKEKEKENASSSQINECRVKGKENF
jgi:hypothetical protein